MNKSKSLLLIFLVCCSTIAYPQESRPETTITIPSYLLRDRAIVLDSVVMKKLMYVSFKSSLPLSKIKGGAALGKLSHPEGLMAYDTAYLFDEAAGNLGFSLPYHIPEGQYHLDIKIINSKVKVLDSFSGEYDRSELGPYFRRSIPSFTSISSYYSITCKFFNIYPYTSS